MTYPQRRRTRVVSKKNKKTLAIPPSTASLLDKKKMKTLLTRIVAKQLYGGFRKSATPKISLTLQDLLTSPALEPEVLAFLRKAKLDEAISHHNALLRTQELHYRAVSCVMCVGCRFDLSENQLRRFLQVAERSLRLMRRDMRNIINARRQCILNAIVQENERLRISPHDFGPLECSTNRKPKLFNDRFFDILNKAFNKMAANTERCT